MKICLINNLFAPYERGGAEKVVGMIAEGIKSVGHEVFIISTRPYFFKKEIQDEFRVFRLRSLFWSLNKMPLMLRLFWHVWDMFDIIGYLRIKAILKKERPDVVFTHNVKGIGCLVFMACESLGIKIVHTLHDIQMIYPSGLMTYGNEGVIDNVFARFYSELNVMLSRGVSVVISPSRWLLELYLRRGFFGKARQHVMLNPMSDVGVGRKVGPGEGKRILFVGQIECHKGVFELVEAFYELGDEYELEIIGEGRKKDELLMGIEKCERIKYLGRLEKSDVLEEMRGCGLLVVPSKCYENSPTVIYEAMMVGLPVVAGRIGGMPELVMDEYLFRVGDVESMRQKITEVAERRDVDVRSIYRFSVSDVGIDGYINQLLTSLR